MIYVLTFFILWAIAIFIARRISDNSFDPNRGDLIFAMIFTIPPLCFFMYLVAILYLIDTYLPSAKDGVIWCIDKFFDILHFVLVPKRKDRPLV